MPLSLLDTNLRLLDGKLRTLHDSAYFDRRVLKYVAALRAIIEQLVDPNLGIDDDVRLFVSAQVWQGERGRPQDLAETPLTCALPDFHLEQSILSCDHALLKKQVVLRLGATPHRSRSTRTGLISPGTAS